MPFYPCYNCDTPFITFNLFFVMQVSFQHFTESGTVAVRGEAGWEIMGGTAFFPEQRRARLPLPPNPPISLPHIILPYKLTHCSSHPLQGQPNGPSEMHMKCRGMMGTPRVGEIYLPIPHPNDMCSGEKINNLYKPRQT